MKVAVAGLGNMGSKIISPIQSAPQTTSIVGFDPSPDMRSRAEQKFSLDTVDSYEKILADPEVRVVFVTAPNATHKPLTLQALQAGKAVMWREADRHKPGRCRGNGQHGRAAWRLSADRL